MTDEPRFGNTKYATIRRDFDRLRKSIQSWDAEETEKAWDNCERWMEAIGPFDGITALQAQLAASQAQVAAAVRLEEAAEDGYGENSINAAQYEEYCDARNAFLELIEPKATTPTDSERG